ncbi:hypothetical protein F7R05_22030 [Pseudomonas koreensis]|nr:hypothetical protein F7R05_22030 [Pseudomonas koreensis]
MLLRAVVPKGSALAGLAPGHLHHLMTENGERPPRCQRRALEDDHHEIVELIRLARRGKPEGRRPSHIQAADSRPSMSPRIGRKR